MLHECLVAAALRVLVHETVLIHKFIDICDGNADTLVFK